MVSRTSLILLLGCLSLTFLDCWTLGVAAIPGAPPRRRPRRLKGAKKDSKDDGGNDDYDRNANTDTPTEDGPYKILSRVAASAAFPTLTDAGFEALDDYIANLISKWLQFSFIIASRDANNLDTSTSPWTRTISWYSLKTYFPMATDPYFGTAELEKFEGLTTSTVVPDVVAANKLMVMLEQLEVANNNVVQIRLSRFGDDAETNVVNFMDMISADTVALANTSPGVAIGAREIQSALGFDVDSAGHFYSACNYQMPDVASDCASAMENLGKELIMSGKELYVMYGIWNMGVIFLRDLWRSVDEPETTPAAGSAEGIQLFQVKALARSIQEDQFHLEELEEIREELDMILASVAEKYVDDFVASLETTLGNADLLNIALGSSM